MNRNITSTVGFSSNLYPINGWLTNDPKFQAAIHDPFALKAMNDAGIKPITAIQREEYNAAIHCSFAAKGDYSYGTIINASNNKQVVCKCINTKCKLFKQCRPNFDIKELKWEADNKAANAKIKKLIDSFDKYKSTPAVKNAQQNSKTLSALLSRLEKLKRDAEKINVLIEKLNSRITKLEKRKANSANTAPISRPTSVTNVASAPKATPVAPVQNSPVVFPQRNSLVELAESLPSMDFTSFDECSQQDIITFEPEIRTVVNAGPGTGKTWTLIERIKYMLTAQAVEPGEMLVLCFSRAAVAVIRKRLKQAADEGELPLTWQEIDVRTFDSFATYLLYWAMENVPSLLQPNYSLVNRNYDQRIRDATEVIKKSKDILDSYRHLIIDEVQDLVGVRAEMVIELLRILPDKCGFTILGDSCQSLYDYIAQKNSNIIDSEKFYKLIYKYFPNACYRTLTDNHRQADSLGALTVPYREAILSGNMSNTLKEAQALNNNTSTSDIKMSRFNNKLAHSVQKEGSLGILTRTNGQALRISSQLRDKKVAHILQKPINSNQLASWIVRILTAAATDVLSKDEFLKLFKEAYPNNVHKGEDYWNALISTQKNTRVRHFHIEDILCGLSKNPKEPLLFKEPDEQESYITVSNIHRAKGMEFDNVLVLEELLANNANNNDILEHKVAYVAFTRAKKKIAKLPRDKYPHYIHRLADGRCFEEKGRSGHKYLSHFEVGDSSDMDTSCFAANKETQDSIRMLTKDTKINLIRCAQGTKSHVVYAIVPEDTPNIVLGYTTESFADNIKKAIQHIYNNKRQVGFNYYPPELCDIYVNGLTTCISVSPMPGAKQFGRMYIWYGLDISGFAHR